jgi:hypothetical protein
MKTTEILTALNLTKRKETTNFASKLASLFTFLKEIKKDIKEAGIVETDLTINQWGKMLTTDEQQKEYKFSLIHSSTLNDATEEKLRVDKINATVYDVSVIREDLGYFKGCKILLDTTKGNLFFCCSR